MELISIHMYTGHKDGKELCIPFNRRLFLALGIFGWDWIT